MVKKAFILGAGLGLRLRPLTSHCPKPALPILGHPLIEYILRHVGAIGVKEVMINTHHCPEVYRKILDGRSDLALEIQYSYEKELLDTGGGLKKIEPFLGEETFLMYNGDILTDGDLTPALHFHRERKALATLVLIPHGSNDNVAMDGDGWITDFRGVLKDEVHPRYTFSGIHILEPEILKSIPENRPISMVDIYLDLLREGKKIVGYVWKECFWRDIGDPQAYQKVQREVLDGKYRNPFPLRQLGQDGSDRLYYRTQVYPSSVIIMHYGKEKKENSYYVPVARFLKSLKLNVPEVTYDDPESGIVVVEDLGNTCLYHAVLRRPRSQVLRHYEDVIQQILALHRKGGSLYEIRPFRLSLPFTRKTYLWESSYFEENFLTEVLNFKMSVELKNRFDSDRTSLAQVLSEERRVLIHRDLQSKNIMIKRNRVYFIDFQGMRYGLPQYDLASLLYDPYVALTEEERESLYHDYLAQAGASLVGEQPHFRRIYQFCILQRLMQALGAYGFLGLKKGKRQFLQYIPVAVERLDQVLAEVEGLDGLKVVVQQSKNRV